MNKPATDRDPLAAIIGEIVAESRTLPVVTMPWLTNEALRRLNRLRPGYDALALSGAAALLAQRALASEYDGGAKHRRYPVNRDGELCFVLTDLLTPGEAVDLAAGLRAQAQAAAQHADIIEMWRRQRWPEFAIEGVQ
jgi:hypothetical protein